MDTSPPPMLWSQPPLATKRSRKPPVNPVILIILIPILALIFLFLLLPPILYHTSHILKPGYVKSTWDSINIFLVLFAILCGVMARKDDDVSSPDSFVAESSNSNSSSAPSSDYFDVDVYYNNTSTRIDRENVNLNTSIPFCSSSLHCVYEPSQQTEEEQVEISNVKEIVVDTFVVSPHVAAEQPLARTPPPPPPAPPPPTAPSYNSKKHSFRSVAKDKLRAYTPPPPPPPPPPPVRSHHKHKSLERKVSDATKELATAISSLYNHSKRKNKRKLRYFEEAPRTLALPPPPPPPPLPPPPPSVFHNLFTKGSKHKRIHSVPAPPPPPPPPSSIFNNIFKSGGKIKRLHSPNPPPSSIMNSLFKTGTNSCRYSDYIFTCRHKTVNILLN